MITIPESLLEGGFVRLVAGVGALCARTAATREELVVLGGSLVFVLVLVAVVGVDHVATVELLHRDLFVLAALYELQLARDLLHGHETGGEQLVLLVLDYFVVLQRAGEVGWLADDHGVLGGVSLDWETLLGRHSLLAFQFLDDALEFPVLTLQLTRLLLQFLQFALQVLLVVLLLFDLVVLEVVFDALSQDLHLGIFLSEGLLFLLVRDLQGTQALVLLSDDSQVLTHATLLLLAECNQRRYFLSLLLIHPSQSFQLSSFLLSLLFFVELEL